MLNTIKTKNKSPSTLNIFNMKTVMTLGDRLKLAGIKELRPHPDRKPPIINFKKTAKKRKSEFKISTARKIRNTAFLSKDSNKNLDLQDKTSSKILTNSSTNLRKNIKKSTEETLFVSLDFIKDCQKYKNKLRNSKVDSQSKSLSEKRRAFSTDFRINLKKEDSKNFQHENSVSQILKENNKEKERSNLEDFSFPENKKSEKLNTNETVENELKCSINEVPNTIQNLKPLPEIISVENVARIDRKYLESLLSLAANTEEKKKKALKLSKIATQELKKTNEKAFCNNETKNKDLEVNSRNEGKFDVTKEKQTTLEKTQNGSQKDNSSTRIVRDLTKSEAQIKLRQKKYIGSQRNSENKIEKDVNYLKSELNNDGRKKRKPRKKFLKNNNEEMIEIPFSNEASKTNDVKELWRRETQKKSENSLTSHSSCTIPESDEMPKWKNLGLQSYRILQKLVEKEINKISKKSENKNNIREVKNKEPNVQNIQEKKTESLKEAKAFNKFKFPILENQLFDTYKKEALEAKEKLTQNCPNYEGDKSKSYLLSILVQDKLNFPQLMLPGDTEKKFSKTPAQAVQNWSIVNRLEQAFLALTGPNIQNENAFKNKQASKNGSPQNGEILAQGLEESEKQKKIKPQNQITSGIPLNKKTFRLPGRSRLNDIQSPSKKKTQEIKSPSVVRDSVQSKEKNKQNKSCKKKSSNVLMQNENLGAVLERKETFDVISLKDPSTVHAQKSKSCNKIDNYHEQKREVVKKRFLQTKKEEPKNCEKEKVKNNVRSRSNNTEKKEVKAKPAVLENVAKLAPKEKTLRFDENYKGGMTKRRVIQKKKFEKTVPIEEISKQQTQDKKETDQRNPNERIVKGRSILSMSGNQHGVQGPNEKLQQIQQGKTTYNFTPVLKSSTGDLLIKNVEKNFEELVQTSSLKPQNNNSNIACKTTGTHERLYSTLVKTTAKNSQTEIGVFSPKKNQSESRENLTSASSLSQSTLFQQCLENEKDQVEFTNQKSLLLWERDIHRYREIVKDIMSQYKRIDGFLKQSKQLESSSNKFILGASSKNHNTDESIPFSTDSQPISLQEYRKKIITEYQVLPFFEYKQRKREEKMEEAKKRNLSVVTDIKTEMDFDVKDYPPNVKKVLDSQLYVDTENLFQRNNLEGKIKDKKKSSLQEMAFNQNDNGIYKKHCLRSFSTPRTLNDT